MRMYAIFLPILLTAIAESQEVPREFSPPVECPNFAPLEVFRTQILHRQCIAVSNADIRAFVRIPYDVRNYRIVDCAAAAEGQPPSTLRVVRNLTQIQEALIKRDDYGRPFCYIVVFYGSGCPFSVKMAEVVNALPRIYPQLNVLAIDATYTTKFNSRYGVAGTPTVILYQDSHVRARVAAGYTPLENVVKTISDFTDLKPATKNFTILEDEKIGPLVVEPDSHNRNIYLASSLVGLFLLFLCSAWNTEMGQSIVAFVKTHFRAQNANV